MEKTVTVNATPIKLKPTANFLFYYTKARLSGEDAPDFQVDLRTLAGMDKFQNQFENITDENAFDVLSQTNIFEFSQIIRRMLWTFAYSANKSLATYEDWCDSLEDYDAIEVAKVVMELVNENFFLMLGVKPPMAIAR